MNRNELIDHQVYNMTAIKSVESILMGKLQKLSCLNRRLTHSESKMFHLLWEYKEKLEENKEN